VITLKTKKGQFAEIYDDGLRFSLMKRVSPDVYEAYRPNTCCKDFFTDAFWAETNGKATSIHGFSWNPGMMSLDEPWYYMVLEHSSDLADMASNVRHLLNAFEYAYDFPLSQVKAVGKKLLVAFTNEWTRRPVLISMVTALMRLGLIYKGSSGNFRTEDDLKKFFANLLKEGNPFGEYDSSEFRKAGVIPTILDSFHSGNPPHPDQTFEQYKEAYSCHHRGGLIAHTTGMATG
jgi:hypothetical protein